MKRTLADNIKKLARVTEAIEHLSKSHIYYVSSYSPQAKCDKENLKLLKRTIKSMERLTVVIKKQSITEMRGMFPHFLYGTKI